MHPSDAGWTEEHGAADRERQVRLTAQRLIVELLPGADETTGYDLDLTGAALEYFELTGRRLGQLIARRARFYGTTRLDGIRADRIVLFTGAVFAGRTDLWDAHLDDGLSLFEAQIHGGVAGGPIEGATNTGPAHPAGRSGRCPTPRGPRSRWTRPQAGPSNRRPRPSPATKTGRGWYK